MTQKDNNITKEELEKEIMAKLQKRNLNSSIDELVSNINSLPNTINRFTTNLNGEVSDNSVYYVVIIKTDHEISYDDSYIAMYSKKNQHGMSHKDYLFRVTSRTMVGAVNNLINAYYELEKRKIIKNREWEFKYKCLNFNIDGNKTNKPSYKFIQP